MRDLHYETYIWMISNNMTAAQFAKHAGVTRRAVMDFLQRRRYTRQATRDLIAEALTRPVKEPKP